jgi:seryl-tRNA synthetase
MLDLRHVVDHLPEVRAQLLRRGPQAVSGLDAIAELAERRRALVTRLDALRAAQNEANAAMAKADKKGPEFAERRDALKRTSQDVKALEGELRVVEADIERGLLAVPNVPSPKAPDGRSEADNTLLRHWGDKPALPFTPRDHVDLGQALGLIDFERARKLSGSRFVVLKGAGARLTRALMSFMLDLHTREHGYTEIWPPTLVTDEALRGTGQLPKFGADLFKIAPIEDEGVPAGEAEKRDLYLIPTAEVPVTNLHRDEILDSEQLPIAYCAYSACFRSEAGSYGKDTRGMIRLHQFDKIELVRFERPEDAEAALEQMTAHAEEVLKRLQLHYRVMDLCVADLGASPHRTYDIEVWLPGQNAYREVSSCSWFGDYQARRAKIRYRPEKAGKPRLLHTLNGSGLPLGRTMVAVLEQYQQADGSVKVPDVLIPYMGGVEVLR